MNLPYETYLKHSIVTLYGGLLRGLKVLNVSLGGEFIVYPPTKLDSDTPSVLNLNSITVLDGGTLLYQGTVDDWDTLYINLEAGLLVTGGGTVTANRLNVNGKTF